MKFDVTPMAKPRMTRADRWKKRPIVLRYFAFKDTMNLLAGRYKVPPILTIEFHIPMANSWSKKKKKEMLGKPHQQIPDLDNYIKAFLDALCKNDSYVHEVHAKKRWADKGVIICS